MKDADYEAVKNYCKPIAKEWLTLMGLSWDSVDLLWTDSLFSMENEGHPPNCIAYCDADWRYLHASVTFSCAKIFGTYEFKDGKPESPDEVREMIIHELGHILVNEMREWRRHSDNHNAVDHEERVVTRMARAFAYTWDQAFEAGRKAQAGEPNS